MNNIKSKNYRILLLFLFLGYTLGIQEVKAGDNLKYFKESKKTTFLYNETKDNNDYKIRRFKEASRILWSKSHQIMFFLAKKENSPVGPTNYQHQDENYYIFLLSESQQSRKVNGHGKKLEKDIIGYSLDQTEEGKLKDAYKILADNKSLFGASSLIFSNGSFSFYYRKSLLGNIELCPLVKINDRSFYKKQRKRKMRMNKSPWRSWK